MRIFAKVCWKKIILLIILSSYLEMRRNLTNFYRLFYVLSAENLWSSLSLWLIYIFCKCFSLWSSSASDLASERGLWFSLRRRRGGRLGTNLNRTSDRISEKTDLFLTLFWPTYFHLSCFWLLGVSKIRLLYVARG